MKEETARLAEREEHKERQFNDLWRTLPDRAAVGDGQAAKTFPDEPQENILYFVEKFSPKLETWERELVRIVRKLSQYFYPQAQTKVMNEGWATFWHYTILNRLHEQRPGRRRVHVRVPEEPHQRRLPAVVRLEVLQRHQSVCARLRDVLGPARASARSRPTRTAPGSPTSRAATGRRRSTSRCATSRTSRSSRSTCRRASSASCACSRSPTTAPRARSRSTASTTTPAIAACASSSPQQHAHEERVPDVQIVRYDRDGDRSLTLRHTQRRGRRLNDAAARGRAAPAPAVGLPGAPRDLGRRRSRCISHRSRSHGREGSASHAGQPVYGQATVIATTATISAIPATSRARQRSRKNAPRDHVAEQHLDQAERAHVRDGLDRERGEPRGRRGRAHEAREQRDAPRPQRANHDAPATQPEPPAEQQRLQRLRDDDDQRRVQDPRRRAGDLRRRAVGDRRHREARAAADAEQRGSRREALERATRTDARGLPARAGGRRPCRSRPRAPTHGERIAEEHEREHRDLHDLGLRIRDAHREVALAHRAQQQRGARDLAARRRAGTTRRTRSTAS